MKDEENEVGTMHKGFFGPTSKVKGIFILKLWISRICFRYHLSITIKNKIKIKVLGNCKLTSLESL